MGCRFKHSCNSYSEICEDDEVRIPCEKMTEEDYSDDGEDEE